MPLTNPQRNIIFVNLRKAANANNQTEMVAILKTQFLSALDNSYEITDEIKYSGDDVRNHCRLKRENEYQLAFLRNHPLLFPNLSIWDVKVRNIYPDGYEDDKDWKLLDVHRYGLRGEYEKYVFLCSECSRLCIQRPIEYLYLFQQCGHLSV